VRSMQVWAGGLGKDKCPHLLISGGVLRQLYLRQQEARRGASLWGRRAAEERAFFDYRAYCLLKELDVRQGQRKGKWTGGG